MTETKPKHDPWEATERMQALTAKRRKKGDHPISARGQFTPPRSRAAGRPAIDSPLQRSPDFAHLGDGVGAHT
jgi:hypothetical protein